MTDIASLGLAVDSKQVEQARDELSRFVSSAKAAETAAGNLSRTASRDMDEAGRKTEAAGKKLRDFVSQYDKATNARMAGAGRDDRQADLDAYGKHLDDLRAKYNPLYAAERRHQNSLKEIAGAFGVGALSQAEMAHAIHNAEQEHLRSTAALVKNGQAMAGNTKTAALNAQAMANLSFQLNDVATMAAMGTDAFRILATQGSQFYQILQQGEGGVKGSLGFIGGKIASFVTPLRLATAGALGFAAAAVTAASSWRSAQHDINLTLIGTGSLAGTTAAQINEISMRAAATGKTTVGSARDMALAFASTGKIATGLNEQLIGMSKGFGALFGETAEEGAARLARMFADPAKGVDELNKRLMSFDAATVQNIKNLTDQGRRFEAQRLLIAGIATATKQAEAETSGWSNAWKRLTATASEYWAMAGQAIDSATGGGGTGLEAQLREAERRLAEAKRGHAVGRGGGFVVDIAEVAKEKKAVEDLTRTLKDAGKAVSEVAANARSLDLSNLIDGIAPEIRSFQESVNALSKLSPRGRNGSGSGYDTEAYGKLSSEQQAAYDKIVERSKERAEAEALALTRMASQRDIAKQEADFALQDIQARTAEQRADVAYRQTLANLERAGDPAAKVRAQAAASQVLAQENRRIGDEIRQRNFSAQQSADLAQLELSLVGKTTDEADRLRAAFQARQQVEAYASQSNRSVRKGEIEDLQRLVELERQRAEEKRKAELSRDLDFEQAQMGRSETEQAVYSRMQSAGLLANGQIPAENEWIAARMRLNEQMQRTMDIQKEFSSTFLHDMMAGKSATEALGDALNNLASKMLDNSLNLLFSGLTQGGAIKGGGLLGGNILPGIFHSGGTVGSTSVPTRAVPASLFANAKRYHNGGVIGADEVPAILQKGERVLSRKEVSGGSGGGTVISMPVTIDARGAYPESIAQINARLDKLPAQMMRAANEAKSRGMSR